MNVPLLSRFNAAYAASVVRLFAVLPAGKDIARLLAFRFRLLDAIANRTVPIQSPLAHPCKHRNAAVNVIIDLYDFLVVMDECNRPACWNVPFQEIGITRTGYLDAHRRSPLRYGYSRQIRLPLPASW